ncbi:MAG TPA: hypothetical protein VJN63_12065 [Thermoplasmata archaeon]|nr:hypothetical protein [Thermoplasmata archaeon]
MRSRFPVALVEDFVQGVLQLFDSLYNTPAAYLSLTFGFSVLVAIILPIPIEAVLIAPVLQERWGYLTIITASMAAGKTVGAWLIFFLGIRVEGRIREWSERYRTAARVVAWCERFVRRTNYLGLYVLLSIPLMSDTIPLYLYSLFNEEGRALNRRAYLVSNFLAAWTRTGLLVFIFLAFQVFLV